jgi:hypothetical protein
MKTSPHQRLRFVVSLVALAVSSLLLHSACARAVETDLGNDGLLFTPDAGDAGLQNACVQTECPPPYATCTGSRGPCTTNLLQDIDHCGACGSPCPRRPANAESICAGGQCRIACDELYADCNGSVADGCETAVDSDPVNCGGCGLKCKDGVICWLGACGCPSGFTQCGQDCKRLDSDAKNCGACGNVCKAPTDPGDPAWTCGPNVTPSNTEWTCLSGSCGLSCKPPFGDCNKNFCGDGCELDLSSDPLNCGACGKACLANQRCENGTCMCPEGTVDCDGDCVDIAVDPRNCGSCGRKCPGPSARSPRSSVGGSPACKDGECSYVCFPGFADCDDWLGNGCEANLRIDQNNCGACGTKCNARAGQPCVEGKCLTKECDGGVVF